MIVTVTLCIQRAEEPDGLTYICTTSLRWNQRWPWSNNCHALCTASRPLRCDWHCSAVHGQQWKNSAEQHKLNAQLSLDITSWFWAKCFNSHTAVIISGDNVCHTWFSMQCSLHITKCVRVGQGCNTVATLHPCVCVWIVCSIKIVEAWLLTVGRCYPLTQARYLFHQYGYMDLRREVDPIPTTCC